MSNDTIRRPAVLSPQQLMTQDFPVVDGIFICHNTTKQQYHIGMSNAVYQSAQRTFRGEGHASVYHDYCAGDSFTVTIRPLEGSGLYSLVTLANHYIDRYNANENTYA